VINFFNPEATLEHLNFWKFFITSSTTFFESRLAFMGVTSFFLALASLKEITWGPIE
jgi:hypothetical protein